jgi:hypothetical protein
MAVSRDSGAIHLLSIAEAKISNQPWVNLQSAGDGCQSAPTLQQKKAFSGAVYPVNLASI